MAVSLTVTADELDALARRLGARRFPGVAGSLFDTVDVERHGVLADRLLATLVARGLVAERDSRLVATRDVATLLGPALRGTTRYEVERVEPDARVTTAVGEAGGAVVWHRADGPYHRFDLVGTDGDVARALVALVDASPGPDTGSNAGPDTGRAFRAPRSRLAAAGERRHTVPAAFAALADGWRATTTVTRLAAPGGVPELSWLSILDGGPGRVWLLEPDPDSPDDGLLDGEDPLCRVTPIDPESLYGLLSVWCS